MTIALCLTIFFLTLSVVAQIRHIRSLAVQMDRWQASHVAQTTEIMSQIIQEMRTGTDLKKDMINKYLSKELVALANEAHKKSTRKPKSEEWKRAQSERAKQMWAHRRSNRNQEEPIEAEHLELVGH